MYASGLVLILGGILAALIQFSAMPGPGEIGFVRYPLYGLFFSVIIGVFFLRLPQQGREFREKRLQEYRAAAPPDAPLPVEIPAPPDTVSMSLLFGVLALVAPLASSLLTVMVFGPAAVVCGVVALSLGHLKGLIGMVLGIVGLILWGLLFFWVVGRIL
jgi:hypothetical protein